MSKIKRWLTQWVISEWSVISDKVTYWAVCGQLKSVFLEMYFLSGHIFSKCMYQNIFLKVYFSKCISQNIYLKIYFSKYISQNVFFKMCFLKCGTDWLYNSLLQMWKHIFTQIISEAHADFMWRVFSWYSTDFFLCPPIFATLRFFNIYSRQTKAFGANAPSSVAFHLPMMMKKMQKIPSKMEVAPSLLKGLLS